MIFQQFMSGIPKKCKCGHVISDHNNKRLTREHVMVKEWRGECQILDSQYKHAMSYDVSCTSGNSSGTSSDCDVSIRAISGCQFENSISQLRENTGIGMDQDKMRKTSVQGIHAKSICLYLDMPCPENPVFRTMSDHENKLISVSTIYKDTGYNFKIVNDTLYLQNVDDPKTYSNITELLEK